MSLPPVADAPVPEPGLWGKGYGYFLANMTAATLAIQIQNTIVGYQIYQLTGDPLSLGMVGLAEAVPFVALVLFGGHLADRVDRRRVSLVGFAVLTLVALGLCALSRRQGAIEGETMKHAIYALIVVTGVCRSFIQPARAAMSQQLTPRAHTARGVAWRTGLFQLAAVTGPAAGGFVYGFWGAAGGYTCAAGLLLLAMAMLLRLQLPPRAAAVHPALPIRQSLFEGLSFIRGDRLLRAAIVLDLLAVLFGGATALLPAFATDVLGVGAQGFGMLRAAPAAGALLASALLALSPPMRKAGRNLLLAVAAYGLCMVGFALSRWFWLSLVLLGASGAFDMVSVLVRSTLLQLRVPDRMIGRVAAINQVFIGSSNEIGAFESGVAARIFGLVPSVLLGGSVTLAVVAVCTWRAKELRALGPLAP